jgi:signal peptidase I
MKKSKTKFGKFMNKFWDIVWRDNTPKGWIISIIFLFLIIKFVFFPLMNLVTGTALPLVIVESCSMYHDKNLVSNYDIWWEDHTIKYFELGITKEIFKEFKFRKGFTKGDILFVTGTKPEKINLGDVIIFESTYSSPIIHRVIEITKSEEKYTFSTIGDNNNGQLVIEKNIPEENIIGKAQARIGPYIGWIKLIFFEPLRAPSERGFCDEN